jgi:hypothetical protein
MKFLTKILTVAAITVLGTSVWAGSDVAEIQDAHQVYLDADPDESDQALGDLSAACDSNCNRFSCRVDGELAEACATLCPYDDVKNCVKAWDSTLKTSKDVKVFLTANGIKVDANGVPGAPTTPVKKKPQSKPKKRTLFDRVNDTFSGVRGKVSKTVSGGKCCPCKGDDDVDDDGATAVKPTAAAAPAKATAAKATTAAAPAANACTPDDAAQGLC